MREIQGKELLNSFWLPKDAGRHFYKFKLENGKWITKRCENIRDLLKLLKNNNITDAYYSACSYQFPKEVDYPKSGWKGHFIKGQLCLDFDWVNYKTVLDAIAFIKRVFRLSPEYLLKSRRGHYQAVSDVPNRFYRPYKNSRRDGFNRYVKKVYSALEMRGYPIDLRLKESHSHRVIRLPYYPRTLNGKTIVPQFVPIPPRSGWGGDSVRKMKHLSLDKNTLLARHPPQPPSTYYQAFMSGKVAGTKDRQVLIIKSQSCYKLYEFCRKNNIPEISIFNNGKDYYFMSHKTFPQARIRKLYKRWYGKAKKYSYLPISPRIGKRRSNSMKYVRDLYVYEEPRSHRSKPHIEMLNKFYGQKLSYLNMHGDSSKQNILIGRLG